MTRKRRRLWLLLACGLGLGSAATLSLIALRQDIVFFVTPTDLQARAHPGQTVRLGGLVAAGSWTHATEDGSPVASFRVTDKRQSVPVIYKGILPDLFREGQGVVVLGTLKPDGQFMASEVLAKHSENYMPKEAVDALKRSGQWKGAAAGQMN